MKLDIKLDKSKLKGLTSKQVDRQGLFALSQTLTQVAYEAREETQRKLPNWLQLTRAFIPRSIVVNRATPKKLSATVGFLDRVKLIELMEEGGIRRPQKRTIAVPVGVKRTGKGAISRANKPQALLAQPNVFMKTINGTSGIWQRTVKRGRTDLKLLYVFKDHTEYDTPKIDFKDTVEQVARREFANRFIKNLDRAISTMKR